MNAAFELIPFTSPEALVSAVASAWLHEIAAANRSGVPHCVALSGGRITLKFFAAVSDLSTARNISLGNVHFFWADERCVPPDDKESSYAAAAEHFFGPLAIAPDVAAQLAAEDIRKTVSLNALNQPMLDVVFLGMGEDGHVASLFPEEPEIARLNPAIYRAIANSPKPPLNRVTLGYDAIAAARNVWVLASGAGKQVALRESLSSEGNTPLARVLKSCRGAKVFTDIQVG